jgi:hypothetical protein
LTSIVDVHVHVAVPGFCLVAAYGCAVTLWCKLIREFMG